MFQTAWHGAPHLRNWMGEMGKEARIPPTDDGDDRRRFPRVKAPIYCRPAHRRLPKRQVVDVGLGGMRVYSDEPFEKGAKFEVELFLPDGESVTCLTEVVWIRGLPAGPAKYDIGLTFLHVPEDARDRLAQVLGDD
jgi:hypothetical protein